MENSNEKKMVNILQVEWLEIFRLRGKKWTENFEKFYVKKFERSIQNICKQKKKKI